jgi:Fic family protein
MKKPTLPSKHWRELVREIDPRRLVSLVLNNPEVRPTIGGRYRHWDSLRHLEPPGDLTSEEWWAGVRMARTQISQPVPLEDRERRPFTIALPGVMLQMLQQVDKGASGQLALSEQVTSPATRKRYLVSSLIEEAITSSQLEGASTSRRVAKEMLRSGRQPRTKSEQMILNNYRAMNFVGEHNKASLTPEMVLELHRIVTEDTLDDPDAAGRLQAHDEDRVGVFDEYGELLHTPPDAADLPHRLQTMCDFANREDENDDYLHPVVRSIILHFWLAYDHPFIDGNGRTARALFYWSMLHRGYWLTEFLTVSSILKKAPAKYARSYLYTEWDDNDLTYFVLYQLEVLLRAIDELQKYLRRKMRDVRDTEQLLRTTDLNHRQIALIGYALRTPGATFTFRTHQTSHNIAYQSARNDLLDLEARGLVHKRKRGRAFTFFPVDDLAEQLRQS